VTHRRPARALTTLAAGLLVLDAVLLVLAGLWSARPWLIAWGVLFGAGAIAVLVLRRRYVKRLEELADARNALRGELGDLAKTLRSHRR
jgi:membrane protein implicated in regulation of membrane protease activity